MRASEENLPPAVRLAVLREAGLSAAPDEGMERFARLVASMLGVPVALVSLVEAGRQVFPGLVGLAEPWATSRQTPLSQKEFEAKLMAYEKRLEELDDPQIIGNLSGAS